jgi:ATP-dependent protease Clp, ATPase subunit
LGLIPEFVGRLPVIAPCMNRRRCPC